MIRRMINKMLRFLKEILERLIKEKSIRKTIGFINFTISKRIPYFFSPLEIYIEVTTKCNLDCITCDSHYGSNRDRTISFNNFKYILEKFPFLEVIGLHGGGEGFLNKDFIKMLMYLKKRKIYIYLITNFTLINEEIAKELINIGCDTIIASIDGATKQTYEEHRRGAKFEVVLNNIAKLTELKRKFNKDKPIIDVNCVVTKKNIHEMISMVHLSKSLGIRNLNFLQVAKWSDNPAYLERFKDLMVDTELFIKNSEAAAKEGKKLNVAINILPNKRLISKCPCKSGQGMFIRLDGSIWFCCEGIRPENKPFGNIFQEGFNFEKAWNSKELRNLRRNISNGKLSTYCHNSNRCIEEEGDWVLFGR